MIPPELAVIVACVVVQAFFAGSEIALVGADRLTLRTRAEEGDTGARRVLALLADPTRIVGTCLVGANVAVIAGSTTVLHLLDRWGLASEILVVLTYAPITILFAELLPKSLFHQHATTIAPVVSAPIAAMATAIRPLLWVVALLTRGVMRLFGVTDAEVHTVRREDIQLLLDSSPSSDIHAEEKAMILRVFNFSETTVQDAMVPLIEMVAIPESATCEEATSTLVESGFSRMPVYRKRVDRIVGIVMHTDLLFATDGQRPVGEVMREIPIVPETKRVDELFLDLRRRRQRLAVAVDEYGGAVGIISIEDILEEIVGEIEDEYDRERPLVRRVGEREWVASGRVERDELEQGTGFRLPDGEFDTLAGYLLDVFGRIPAPSDRVATAGWVFSIVKASDRAIVEVHLQRVPPAGR